MKTEKERVVLLVPVALLKRIEADAEKHHLRPTARIIQVLYDNFKPETICIDNLQNNGTVSEGGE